MVKPEMKNEHKDIIYDVIKTSRTGDSHFDTTTKLRKGNHQRREHQGARTKRLTPLGINVLCIYGGYNTTTLHKISKYNNCTQIRSTMAIHETRRYHSCTQN